jgi:hypothetical protein
MTNVDGAPEKPMDNERVKGKRVPGGSSSNTSWQQVGSTDAGVKNTTNHSTCGEQRSTDGGTDTFIFKSLDYLFLTIENRRTR